MSRLLIVGSVSLDTLHVERNGSRTTYQTIGGAGLYTALAGRVGGAQVTLFAPKPSPIPTELMIIDRLLDWRGPICEPDALPRLEIAHHGGGKATLLNASWGAEALLTPEEMPALNDTDIVHIAALSSARSQLAFLERCRENDGVIVSVGTYARLVYQQTSEVRQLFDLSDLFFMNENEAAGLLAGDESRHNSRPRFFVTAGEHGATAYDGKEKTAIPATAVVELDPTGAGDTFCGAALSQILQGQSLSKSAIYACAIASKNVTQVGPAALLDLLQSAENQH